MHALYADEAVLLARELPHLRALIDATVPGVDAAAGRSWVAQALTLSQGHPELLNLANGQAADPAQLQQRLSEASVAWQQSGGIPDGFFTTGESAATAKDYLRLLDAWTRGVVSGLPAGPATLFAFVCALEDNDRVPSVIGSTWAAVWARTHPGDPPDPFDALGFLAGKALVVAERDQREEITGYRIHPVVAAAGRALAGSALQEVVDTELAAYWVAKALTAAGQEEAGGERDLLRAGRGAPPYLLRLGDWGTAGVLLGGVVGRDVSRATAASLLRAVQLIAANAGASSYGLAAGYLTARILENFDPLAARDLVRRLRAAALDQGNAQYYFVFTFPLIRRCTISGRLDEALIAADEQIDYAKRISAGPWTQLMCRAQKLNVLLACGHAERVLPEIRELLAEATDLPATNSLRDYEPPAQVREYLCYVGRQAACELSQWEYALDLGAELLKSARGQDAHESFLARIQSADYAPLIQLGRVDEALSLLDGCREVFERDRNVEGLAIVFAALADVEDTRGHQDRAIDLQRNALRYAYLARNVEGVIAGHGNLGSMLETVGGARSLAHHLTAALLGQLTGSACWTGQWAVSPGICSASPTSRSFPRPPTTCAAWSAMSTAYAWTRCSPSWNRTPPLSS